MKILYVSETYEPDHGGMPTLIRNFTQGLAGQGHDVRLWTRGDRNISYQESQGKVRLYRQRSKPYPLNKGHRVTTDCRHGLEAIMQSWQPDVIHVHIFPSPITAAAIRYGHAHNIPIVITNHAMPENYRNLVTFRLPSGAEKILFYFGWRYLVSICNQATLVSSPTPTALSYLVKAGLKRPGHAISNGIDTNYYVPAPAKPELLAKYKLKPDVPIVLYLGRLDGEKVIEDIVNAAPKITEPYQLVITGKGNNEVMLKSLTRKLKLQKTVTFTGPVDEATKLALYQAASIFTIASPAELQSIVTLEAMSCSLPIVAVAAGALTELCLPEQNGLLFKPHDSVELAGHLSRLLADPATSKAFGQASRQLVQDHHSMTKTISSYEDLYRDAIAEVTPNR